MLKNKNKYKYISGGGCIYLALLHGVATKYRGVALYQNIYNNLSHIQKTKGTFKSLRNFLRCFGVDEELIKLNIYANNDVYEFKDNFSARALQKRFVDNPELYDEQSKLMARTAYDKSVELLQELVELKKGLEGIRTVSDEDKQKRMRAKNLDPNLINKKFQEQYGNTQSSEEATN